MPPNNRGQQKPSNNQRRTFRGRGGPTDGNLPPKKSPRVKVKYQHHPAATPAPDAELEERAGIDIRPLSLDNNDGRINNDSNHDNGNSEEDEDCNDPLLKEINHLQQKIQNITRPLGISSPNTWRTNCLNPIKNVVKQWRSILSFHSQQIKGEGSEDHIVSNCNDDVVMQSTNDSIEQPTELQQLLHETSTKVFILIQMAMQTGPLVGSNPGYFKRCGGEVASIALEFLMSVIDLAGGFTDQDDNDKVHSEEDGDDSSVNDDFDSNNDESSTSSTDDDGEGENEKTAKVAPEASASALTPSTQTKEMQIIQTALEESFLFTEKQTQRVHQWYRNATKAAEANKPPSKTASKLQSQKSKKQRMKDLKMERKLKKENKGRGRK